ncbi:MAG: TRAP transporter small permease [Firmicutes bacterium]|nr:TRAP transporter small permease [Bacillota bacterium]
MRLARILVAASERVARLTEYLGAGVFGIMALLIIIQVFFRYVMQSSLSWSEEVAIYLFIWLVMLGASVGVRRGFHVSVRFVADRLPSGVARALRLALGLLMLLFFGVLVTEGFSLAQRISFQLSPAARIPIRWVYLSVPVSGALSFLHVVAHLMDDWFLSGEKTQAQMSKDAVRQEVSG